jgi:hypothetical protein
LDGAVFLQATEMSLLRLRFLEAPGTTGRLFEAPVKYLMRRT